MGNDRWLMLAGTSSVGLTKPSSGNADPRMTTRLAAQLLGCYRASDANDPDTFVTAAAALLACYPEAIARRVCDPVRGLPSLSKWLPAIAEIRAACETEMVWRDAVERRSRERVKTLAVLAEHRPNPTERQRVVDGFETLCGGGGPTELKPDYARHLEQLRAVYVGMPAPISTQDMENYLTAMQCPRPDESKTDAQ